MKSNEFPTHIFVRCAFSFYFQSLSRLAWIPYLRKAGQVAGENTWPRTPPRFATGPYGPRPALGPAFAPCVARDS